MKLSLQFEGNTEFDIIQHPVYGPAACITAKQPIRKGEELYVNYNYKIRWAPGWYKEAFRQFKAKKKQEEEEEDVAEGEDDDLEDEAEDSGSE